MCWLCGFIYIFSRMMLTIAVHYFTLAMYLNKNLPSILIYFISFFFYFNGLAHGVLFGVALIDVFIYFLIKIDVFFFGYNIIDVLNYN